MLIKLTLVNCLNSVPEGRLRFCGATAGCLRPSRPVRRLIKHLHCIKLATITFSSENRPPTRPPAHRLYRTNRACVCVCVCAFALRANSATGSGGRKIRTTVRLGVVFGVCFFVLFLRYFILRSVVFIALLLLAISYY